MNSLTLAKAMMEDIRRRMISNGVEPSFATLNRAKILEEGYSYNGDPDYLKMAWFVKPEKNGTDYNTTSQ